MMPAASEAFAPSTDRSASGAVLLFDDTCSVCRRLAGFVKRLDRNGRLRFAPLQSLFGDAICRTHGEFAKRDSPLLVRTDGTILACSDAILVALEIVGGQWRRFAQLMQLVPRHFRDRVYSAVASRRNLLATVSLYSIREHFADSGLNRHQW